VALITCYRIYATDSVDTMNLFLLTYISTYITGDLCLTLTNLHICFNIIAIALEELV